VAVLQKQIKWIEEHYHYSHRGRGNTTGNSNNDGVIIEQLKQELTDLLGEDAKADKLTSLPLYSCGLLARNLYVYSKYYDRIYI
jgi:hypothetical protein